MDINTDQRIPVSLVFKDNRGRVATVHGAPVWASSDETVLSVAPDEDGLSGFINSVAPGTARVTFTADADMGEGVREIVGFSEDVNVSLAPAGEATVIEVALGSPEDKPLPSA